MLKEDESSKSEYAKMRKIERERDGCKSKRMKTMTNDTDTGVVSIIITEG